MSLSSILQHVQKKGQVQKPSECVQSLKTSKPSARNGTPKQSTERAVDPVVARLKEKRRLENAKKEQELREKKGLPPKTVKSAPKERPKPAAAGPRRPAAPLPRVSAPSPKPPPKKMNFNDLMKRASTIDQSKLSITLKAKSSLEKPRQASRERERTYSKSVSPVKRERDQFTRESVPLKRESGTYRREAGQHSGRDQGRTGSKRPPQRPISRNPIPLRAPSQSLQEKLKSKIKPQSHARRHSDSEDESEDDMDDFVVSDEEDHYTKKRQQNEGDYDRDEIWAIFNKGKKRSYYDRYDDDSADDMEATGAEVLEEEMRSKRRAELEDRKELEEEQRRAALKRKRMNQ